MWALLGAALAASAAMAQPQVQAQPREHGQVQVERGQMRQTTSEPRPIADSDDPLNEFVRRTTVDGLIVQLLVDGAEISIERAQPARIPARRRDRAPTGDTVTLVALSGSNPVSTTIISDQLLNVQEGRGLVRAERRSLVAAVPTPVPIDAVEVRISVTGTTRRFDVRPAYAELCRAGPNLPVCGPVRPENLR